MTVVKARPTRTLRRPVDSVAGAYLVALGLATLTTGVTPWASGPLAIVVIFLPYLFLPLVPLGLAALWLGGQVAKVSVTVGALLWVILFGPGLVAIPARPSPDTDRLTIASWNVLQDNRDVAALRRLVVDAGASIVALQELSSEQRDALLGDPVIAARYRHRALYPNDRYLGMGLLSSFPVVEEGYRERPPVMWARLDLSGRRILVVNAHPLPGRIAWLHVGDQALPVGFDGVRRDDQIATILDLTESLRRPGEPVLLVGDFNVTEREPAYRRIVAQFGDAKRAAGFGAQNTWKSWFLVDRTWAVLRIDYLFASAEFTPTAFATDCRPSGSDHCLVRGEFALAPLGLP